MRQPTKFGKYLLLERIAVGGMAEVFVAKAFGIAGFERLLAIKKILPTMGEDEEFISMFVDEARISVQLSHANIVQVLELGKHDENLYIAMEYISGRDVRQLLERFRKREQPLPIPQACLVVAKICEALDYAHRKRDARGQPLGIVHRDVSPQNVLVSFEGEVKLIDFGIAKAESRLQKTQAGILKGKFAYMSPEQVRGLAVDGRSDIFAAGVLLWEALCGEKLFTGESDFAILEKVRNGIVPNPRSVNRAIPEALERVMMKALAVEVKDRYQTASELHDDLMRFTLVGDLVYGSRQLAEWIREEFAVDYLKEQGRLRSWLGVEEDDADATPSDPLRGKPAEENRVFVAAEGLFTTPQDPYPAPAMAAASAPAQARAIEQELPTMKMDGDALAQAEREFAARRSAQAAQAPQAPQAPVDHQPSVTLGDDEERTSIEPTPQPRLAPQPPALDKTPHDAVLVSRLEAVARPGSLPPPPHRVTPPALPRQTPLGSPRLSTPPRSSPRSTLPPISRSELIFDNSDERTNAPRALRKGPMSKSLKEQQLSAKQKPSSRRWLLALVPVLLALLAGIYFVLNGADGPLPGKIIVTPAPAISADLYIDGKASGPLPPFVHTVPAGKHRIEVKADGYKTFTAQVTVPSGSRPLEVDAQLQADVPMEVEGVMLTQPAPKQEKTAAVEQEPQSAAKKKPWSGKKEKGGRKVAAAAAEPPPSPAEPARPAQADDAGSRLRIVTDPPGADVTVDGRPVGKSPVTTEPLNPGPYHPVVASLEGYAPSRRAARIDPSAVTELRMQLTQAEAEASVGAVISTGVGYLTAATKPAARVTIDGRETGRWTPVPPANPIALPAGAHTVVFETADGKKHEEQLQIEAGKTARLIRSLP
jgi:serine/threonine protein kinase